MPVITCKERPILFSAPMVRAILAGTKTQTRRIIKPQPTNAAMQGEGIALVGALAPMGQGDTIRCPYGRPGDRLWVRETTYRRPMRHLLTGDPLAPEHDGGAYSASNEDVLTLEGFDIGWWYSRKTCPAIHMPRWASRIDLEVTGVRVERLNDISEADAVAEGIIEYDMGEHGPLFGTGYPDTDMHARRTPIAAYAALWQSINGADRWGANPWVWRVEFKRVNP